MEALKVLDTSYYESEKENKDNKSKHIVFSSESLERRLSAITDDEVTRIQQEQRSLVSLYEGNAMVREKLENSVSDMEKLKDSFNEMWQCVKVDNKDKAIECARHVAKFAHSCACDMLQVEAIATKCIIDLDDSI